MLGVRDEVSQAPIEHHWRRWIIKHSDPDLTTGELATPARDLFPSPLERSLFHCDSRPKMVGNSAAKCAAGISCSVGSVISSQGLSYRGSTRISNLGGTLRWHLVTKLLTLVGLAQQARARSRMLAHVSDSVDPNR